MGAKKYNPGMGPLNIKLNIPTYVIGKKIMSSNPHTPTDLLYALNTLAALFGLLSESHISSEAS